MKKYLSTVIFILIAVVAFAQTNYRDVVYLKNGSVIKGMIIEQVPNKSIKIETADRSIFVYQMDEVEKMTKEPIQNTTNNLVKQTNTNTNNSIAESTNYNAMVELGYQIGVGDYESGRLKLNIINSYQINPYLSVGFLTGLRFYHESEALLLPTCLDFRAGTNFGSLSPYLSVSAGYSFDLTSDFEGFGFIFNPTIGLNFKVSDKMKMNIGVGYEMQRFSGYYYYSYYNSYYGYWDYDSYYNEGNLGALDITVGLTF